MTDWEERAKSLQASIYITLGGLVQSLAFYFLLTEVVDAADAGVFSSFPATVVFILRFAVAFQVILLVWHEYAVGVIFFRWIWTYTDSGIPFLLGLAEFFLIIQVGATHYAGWMAAMAGVAFAGFLSYANQHSKSTADRENELVLNRIGGLRRMSRLGMVALTLLFGLAAMVTHKAEVSRGVHIFTLVLLNLVTLGVWQFARFTLAKLSKPENQTGLPLID